MNIIIFNSLLVLFSASLCAQVKQEPAATLEDFDAHHAAGTWKSINDGVMGGLSKGSPLISNKRLLFKGEISLENNGGFSSIRTSGKTHDLSDYDGIEIRVRGDGRKYYLTARANGRRMLAYWSPIQPPKGKWTVIRVPFKSFYATYFGKKIPALKLNTKKVTSVGFMLYDKKAGPFAIEIDYLGTYKGGAVD